MILETAADRLQLKLPYDLRERAKAAHGYRWDPELKVWYWPKTLVNFLLIRDAIPNLQLAAETSKWLRERTSVPQVNDLATVDARLWPFQKYGVRFLQRVGRALLLDEMGLGKTAQAVVAAQSAGFRRILVLCPKSLQYNWEAEVHKWTGPGTPVRIPTGTAIKKAQQISEAAGASWVVTNWETARYADLDLGWDCIIGDEAHRIRNRKTQLSEAARKLKSDALWLLTGTPIHNSQEDLWQPLNWLYPKEFSSFWSFYEAFVWYQDTMWGREVVGAKNTEVLWKLIAPFSLRRSKAEVLPDLPEKLSIPVPVKLDSKQMTLYKRIERETLIDLQSGERLMVMGALAMLTRLKQAALCPWVFGESQEIPAAKLETALDMITDNASEQFVVYSQYAEVIKVFSRLLQEHGIMPSLLYGELGPKARQEQVLAFTGQQTRVMLATTETGGVGLTFVPASNVIFLDHVWNPAIVRQAEDRIHRIGQKNTCRIYHLVARNTIDETIQGVLRAKSSLAAQVLTPLELIKTHYGL